MQFDCAPEPFALRASANRTVRRKQGGRRLGKRRAALRAIEAAVELERRDLLHRAVLACDHDRARPPPTEIEGFLDSLAHAFVSPAGYDPDAVDNHPQRTPPPPCPASGEAPPHL